MYASLFFHATFVIRCQEGSAYATAMNVSRNNWNGMAPDLNVSATVPYRQRRESMLGKSLKCCTLQVVWRKREAIACKLPWNQQTEQSLSYYQLQWLSRFQPVQQSIPCIKHSARSLYSGIRSSLSPGWPTVRLGRSVPAVISFFSSRLFLTCDSRMPPSRSTDVILRVVQIGYTVLLSRKATAPTLPSISLAQSTKPVAGVSRRRTKPTVPTVCLGHNASYI